MLVLFTDFGLQGPYIGQVKLALLKINAKLSIIDLISDLPAGDIQSAAYLLPAYTSGFPQGSIFLCIVDPGVGGARKPIVVKSKDYWFVGPDNGIFEILAQREELRCWEITWRPAQLSASFHGRDIFAPIAAEISLGSLPDGLEACELSRFAWPADLNQVVYLDHFGNAITGFRGQNISEKSSIIINGQQLSHAETFEQKKPSEAFWYVNSNNLLEFAINRGNCAEELGITLGDKFSIINS